MAHYYFLAKVDSQSVETIELSIKNRNLSRADAWEKASKRKLFRNTSFNVSFKKN